MTTTKRVDIGPRQRLVFNVGDSSVWLWVIQEYERGRPYRMNHELTGTVAAVARGFVAGEVHPGVVADAIEEHCDPRQYDSAWVAWASQWLRRT